MIKDTLESIKEEGVLSTLRKGYIGFILPLIYKIIFTPIGRILGEKSDLLLFGEARGEGYGQGNTKYVYEYIVQNREDLNPVWVTTDDSIYAKLKNKGWPVEKRDSLRSVYLLARAKVGLISHSLRDIATKNSMFPEKKTLIFLDHGSPVKGGFKTRKNSSKEKYKKMNYWIKLSKFHAKHYYEKFPEVDWYPITGFPRNDVLLNSHKTLNSLDIDINFEWMILYAPTKRKYSRWDEPLKLFPFNDFKLKKLISFLESNNVLLLINLHPTTMRELSNPDLKEWSRDLENRLNELINSSDRIRLTSNDTFVSANELLSVTDILITDYSAIYHDFLLLDRPILFFPYDYEKFEKKLGFSYDYFSNLPGPSIESFNHFLNYLNKVFEGKDPHEEDRQKLRNKMHAYIDSSSIQRVVEMIDAIRKNKSIEKVSEITVINGKDS